VPAHSALLRGAHLSEAVAQDARPHTALTRVALREFRSYARLELPLDGRHVCLSGQNGAGKTNILEAISLLAPGRGLRGASLQEVAHAPPGRAAAPASWAISARLEQGGYERSLTLGLETSPEGRSSREARLDGAEVTATALAEVVRVVWLTPSMDGVFAAGAADRRKLYDRLVLAHRPEHGRLATAYEKAMRERNALFEAGRTDPFWFEAIETRLAEAGAGLALNRAQVLGRLQAGVDARGAGPFPKADLGLAGPFEEMARQGADLIALTGALREALRESRPACARAGRTLVGPHRSDLEVVHRPKQMAADRCSTGEQKALLVGLILANARALSDADAGSRPLLLLDEAAAHLDPVRREALYSELASLGGQAWLTGADPALFTAFGDRAQHFDVADGTARQRA